MAFDLPAALGAHKQRVRGGKTLILTHDNPDPDALASAVLLCNLLRRAFKQRATAAYGGIVGRAENREMVRSLHLEISHIRHLSLKRYQRFALVDTQPRTGLPEASGAPQSGQKWPTRPGTAPSILNEPSGWLTRRPYSP